MNQTPSIHMLGREDLPVLVRELELSKPLSEFVNNIPQRGDLYTYARLLVRLHGIPVGYALFSLEDLSTDRLATTLWAQVGENTNALLKEWGLEKVETLPSTGIAAASVPAAGDLPFISVVVCTRNRPEGALRTLRGLMAADYPNFEVVLVDNAPSDDSTHLAVTEAFGNDPRVHYVRENRPGLSIARNRGLAEAASRLVAFTDDDVHVDPLWLRGIARGFSRTKRVGCVTGLVPSAELETASQLYFDQRYTWGAGMRARLYDMKSNRGASALYPYTAGEFGTGANFALNLDVIGDVARFDEALGAGTRTGGGEDLDMFVRTVLAGHQLAYEPSAIITHVHRADVIDLERQLFNYGTGLTAYLTKQILSPRRVFELLRRAPRGVQHLRSSTEDLQEVSLIPASVTRREFQGMLIGPWRYFVQNVHMRFTSSPASEPVTTRIREHQQLSEAS